LHLERNRVNFEVFAYEGIGFAFVAGRRVGNDVFDGVKGLGCYEG